VYWHINVIQVPVYAIDNAAGNIGGIIMSEYWDGREDKFKPIPDAACYVLSNDSFFSYTGRAEGKVNTCIVPCKSTEMAYAVKAYVETRKEQKYIRIVCNKPRAKNHVIYSLVLGWIDRARDYSTVRNDHIDW
jgi:hypothetical protein